MTACDWGDCPDPPSNMVVTYRPTGQVAERRWMCTDHANYAIKVYPGSEIPDEV